MARWARERRHLPDFARISEGFSGQLFDEFWQRFAGIHPLHGQKSHAHQYWRRRQPALSVGGRKRNVRRKSGYRKRTGVEVRTAAGRNQAATCLNRRPVAWAYEQLV